CVPWLRWPIDSCLLELYCLSPSCESRSRSCWISAHMNVTYQSNIAAALWAGLLLPGSAADNASRLSALSAEEWQWLAAEAQRHGLAPLLYNNIHHANIDSLAAEHAIAQLRTIYKHSTLVAMQREAEIRRALDTLA